MAGNLSRPALQDRVPRAGPGLAPGATGAPEVVEVEAGHGQGRVPDLTMIKSGLAGMP